MDARGRFLEPGRNALPGYGMTGEFYGGPHDGEVVHLSGDDKGRPMVCAALSFDGPFYRRDREIRPGVWRYVFEDYSVIEK